MLTDKIITKTLGGADSLVAADRSRCGRMRFSRNTCSHCTAICDAAAISIDGAIIIDAAKCTGCMLCVSECPSGCLSAAGEDFDLLLAKLRKTEKSVPSCVVSCKTARDRSAHAKTSCLGFLSEEHLMVLAGSLDKPLYLDLSACGACRNSFIIDKLRERVRNVQANTGINIREKIILAEDAGALAFEDVSLDRRGFFQALKAATFMQVAGFLDEQEVKTPASYGEKKVTAKRQLLNRLLKSLSDGKAATAILNSYAFTVKTGSSCTVCSACVGMCPTGALQVRKDANSAELLFNSSLCHGCSLCKDICPAAAVAVTSGFNGKNYFEHEICHAVNSASRDAVNKN